MRRYTKTMVDWFGADLNSLTYAIQLGDFCLRILTLKLKNSTHSWAKVAWLRFAECLQWLGSGSGERNSLFYCRKFFSKEAHFWLNRYVNKQNCHIWDDQQPEKFQELPIPPQKTMFWHSLWTAGIIRPYFLRNQASVMAAIEPWWVSISTRWRYFP